MIFYFHIYFEPATRHPSPVTRHPLPVTRQTAPVTRHPSPVTRHPRKSPAASDLLAGLVNNHRVDSISFYLSSVRE